MKIMHIADVHLDSAMSAHLSNEKRNERRAELLASFVRLVEAAKTEKVKAVLISGDLFDTGKVKSGTAKTVMNAIAGAADISFFYIRGNHDNQDVFRGRDDIPPNLHLFGTEWKTYSISDVIDITGVELAGRNSSAVDASLVLNNDKYNIVMLHGSVVMSHTVKDKEFINVKGLKNKGIDYLALGHIHSFKDDRLDGRAVTVYPGCPFGRGFDECGEKGYVILDIDEYSKNAEYRFVSFPARRLYMPEVDVTGLNSVFEITGRIREELKCYDRENLLEVVLKGEVDALLEIDLPFIEKCFEEDYYFFKCKNETKIHVDIDDFRKDATLRGEFVRLVMSREDISEEDRARIVRLGISALAGEKI